MTSFGWPVIATLLLWWASTGAILYLDSRPRRTFVWSLVGSSILLGLALVGLARSRGETTLGGAYEAVSCGLAIWGWQLITFYMGFITGPRREALPPKFRGWARFVEGVRASLYHEIAALLGGVALFALTWDQPNTIGAWTYVLLWWMHQSAKLNVFFGVPNLSEEMLPEHLAYLTSFMRRRPMNLFFPISVTASTVIAVLMVQRALAPQASPAEAAGATMLATLMVLAILEHWFLVAPINANAIWNWSSQAATHASVEFPHETAESDYSTPSREAAQATESWSPDPPANCDARRLHSVLESISAGVFGEVHCVRGVLKTDESWVSFELAGRDARVSALPPQRVHEPLVIAMGRRFDRVRLQAAFDACEAAT